MYFAHVNKGKTERSRENSGGLLTLRVWSRPCPGRALGTCPPTCPISKKLLTIGVISITQL